MWPAPPILGSPAVTGILTEGSKDLLGGYFFAEEDLVDTAERMLAIINEKARRPRH
ncbi:MAG: hypothetical protein R2864_00925 [Syntrophotaleaceae bacterium]